MLLLGHYREKRKKSTKADKNESDEVYGDSCDDEEFLKHSSKKAGYFQITQLSLTLLQKTKETAKCLYK